MRRGSTRAGLRSKIWSTLDFGNCSASWQIRSFFSSHSLARAFLAAGRPRFKLQQRHLFLPLKVTSILDLKDVMSSSANTWALFHNSSRWTGLIMGKGIPRLRSGQASATFYRERNLKRGHTPFRGRVFCS